MALRWDTRIANHLRTSDGYQGYQNGEATFATAVSAERDWDP